MTAKVGIKFCKCTRNVPGQPYHECCFLSLYFLWQKAIIAIHNPLFIVESHSSQSEMLSSQSNRKDSTISIDDNVFTDSVLKKGDNAQGKQMNYVATYIHNNDQKHD